MLLDDFMPAYDINDAHSIIINASPGRVYRSLTEITAGELSPLVNMLFAMRDLPERLVGRAPSLRFSSNRPLIEQMLKNDFIFLAEQPDREIVFGMIVPRTIGQVWKPSSGVSPEISGAREFAEFDDPDYAKVVANFYVDDAGAGGLVRTSTESRIKALSSRTRKEFAVYWRVIYPGSALIRKMLLKAIKRRAERG